MKQVKRIKAQYEVLPDELRRRIVLNNNFFVSYISLMSWHGPTTQTMCWWLEQRMGRVQLM